jgi:hypothetical protein
MCKSRCSVFPARGPSPGRDRLLEGRNGARRGQGRRQGEGSYKYKVGLLTYSLAEEFGVDTLRGARGRPRRSA